MPPDVSLAKLQLKCNQLGAYLPCKVSRMLKTVASNRSRSRMVSPRAACSLLLAWPWLLLVHPAFFCPAMLVTHMQLMCMAAAILFMLGAIQVIIVPAVGMNADRTNLRHI